MKALTGLGIAEKDIQTTGVSVAPRRRQGRPDTQPPGIVGYEVSNQVRVKVRDLGKLGRLLDELVTPGRECPRGRPLLGRRSHRPAQPGAGAGDG